nr:MAG TPA: hypothetical protein [Caudoviricetes sp.]
MTEKQLPNCKVHFCILKSIENGCKIFIGIRFEGYMR